MTCLAKFEGKYPLKLEHLPLQFKVFKNLKLPSATDLRNKCPPIYDQLQLGSCTANALASAHQYVNMPLSGSRLFLYYNERMLDKSINVDAGSTISQGINALKKYGLCKESLWTYSDNSTKFRTKPPTVCYTDALLNQVISANPIAQNLNSMKQCLTNGYPFVFGFIVYESFESDVVSKTGFIPMPSSGEQILGGHAVMCVGYDDTINRFIVRNSWGGDWGDNGYFYMPYAYFTNQNLSGDFWEITKVEIPSPKPIPKPKPKPKPIPRPKPKPKQKKFSLKPLLEPRTKTNIELLLKNNNILHAKLLQKKCIMQHAKLVPKKN